ncbi:MAG: hypothetical protein ACHP6H_06325 [Legionellales bacterium]
MNASNTLLAFNGDKTLKEECLARTKSFQPIDKEVLSSIKPSSIYVGQVEQKFDRYPLLAAGRTLYLSPIEQQQIGKGGVAYDSYYNQKNVFLKLPDLYPTQLGIPAELAYIQMQLFQQLKDELAIAFPEKFIDAIVPGADLENVWPQFALWLMSDPDDGGLAFTVKEARAPVEEIIRLLNRVTSGKPVTKVDWLKVKDIAEKGPVEDFLNSIEGDTSFGKTKDARQKAYKGNSLVVEAVTIIVKCFTANDPNEAGNALDTMFSAALWFHRGRELRMAQKASEKLIELLKAVKVN